MGLWETYSERSRAHRCSQTATCAGKTLGKSSGLLHSLFLQQHFTIASRTEGGGRRLPGVRRLHCAPETPRRSDSPGRRKGELIPIRLRNRARKKQRAHYFSVAHGNRDGTERIVEDEDGTADNQNRADEAVTFYRGAI